MNCQKQGTNFCLELSYRRFLFNNVYKIQSLKKSKKILLLIATFIITWLSLSYLDLQEARNKKELILSPDENKSVEIFKSIGTNQIFLNFHRLLMSSGSNVASGEFDVEKIEIEWIDNNKVLVKYPRDSKFITKNNNIKFFSTNVEIRYSIIDN